jgi:hypothetical protein
VNPTAALAGVELHQPRQGVGPANLILGGDHGGPLLESLGAGQQQRRGGGGRLLAEQAAAAQRLRVKRRPGVGLLLCAQGEPFVPHGIRVDGLPHGDGGEGGGRRMRV